MILLQKRLSQLIILFIISTNLILPMNKNTKQIYNYFIGKQTSKTIQLDESVKEIYNNYQTNTRKKKNKSICEIINKKKIESNNIDLNEINNEVNETTINNSNIDNKNIQKPEHKKNNNIEKLISKILKNSQKNMKSAKIRNTIIIKLYEIIFEKIKEDTKLQPKEYNRILENYGIIMPYNNLRSILLRYKNKKYPNNNKRTIISDQIKNKMKNLYEIEFEKITEDTIFNVAAFNEILLNKYKLKYSYRTIQRILLKEQAERFPNRAKRKIINKKFQNTIETLYEKEFGSINQDTRFKIKKFKDILLRKYNIEEKERNLTKILFRKKSENFPTRTKRKKMPRSEILKIIELYEVEFEQITETTKFKSKEFKELLLSKYNINISYTNLRATLNRYRRQII